MTANTNDTIWLCLRLMATLTGAAILAVCVAAARGDVSKEPLHAEPQGVDFGSVPTGRYSTEITFTNTTSEPVEILHVEKNCACSEVEIPTGVVLPGKTLRGRVALDTHGRIDDIWSYFEVHYKSVSTGLRGHVRVSVHAHSIPSLRVDPDRLSFDSTTPGTIRMMLATSGTKSVRAVTFVAAKAAHPALSATVEEDGRSVAVTFSPERCASQWGRTEVLVETTDEEARYIHIPVTITSSATASSPIRVLRPPTSADEVGVVSVVKGD